MSGKIFKRVQGDVNDTVDVEIVGLADLDNVTQVKAFVWLRRTIVELTAAVQDSPNRIVRIQLTPWLETARRGDWHLDEKLFDNNGQEISWPSGIPDWIRVRGRPALPAP